LSYIFTYHQPKTCVLIANMIASAPCTVVLSHRFIDIDLDTAALAAFSQALCAKAFKSLKNLELGGTINLGSCSRQRIVISVI
jgi:hypothetical protein